MNKLRIPIFAFLAFISMSGCQAKDPKVISSHLKIGMTKAELNSALKEESFLREQLVAVYPNRSVKEMKGIIGPHDPSEWCYPETLGDQLRFDGNEKVFSYLIHKKYVFANGWFFDYLAVFYDQKNDKVVGWGFFHEIGKPETWNDNF
ncbi:MAG: hypothetical protein IPP68_11180 [Elusimicrobia bacterium]|nr:hypothetical protein [Elusimicrobiota bacterium]